MSNDSSPSPRRRTNRFIFFALTVLFLLLFIAGAAALLYWLFSEYSGIRNIWLLVCGAPIIFIVLILFILFNLWNRYGKPMEEIFNAIDAVAEGDLSVRVPEKNSDMYSDLSKRFNKMVSDLERSDRQRRNLTADIAHELRTPLHIIQGNLEGMIDGVYEPSSEQINSTLDEVKLLNRLVNDLQTLSLAEAGQLPLHSTRFRLADLIQDIVSSFSAQAEAQRIELRTSMMNPSEELNADYDRLNQVLSNLVMNALRHTPEGGTISIETESIAGVERAVRIRVNDTGAGIASEDLPFIFDRFWRGDKSRSERSHSGLGLAITKQLILAHGGTIDVQSDVGKGTTFTIDLPLK